MLREIFLYFCQSEYFNLPSKRRRGKSTFTVLLASYLHYTLRHDVLVVDCDYQSSDMRAVEQIPVRCRPGRRKPPFPTVASSKTPKMEIRKARPSGDSHGLAYFHLRRYISCRRKEITGIYQTFLLLRARRYMLFSHGSLSFFPTVRYFYTAMNLSANFILSISTSRSIIGWVTFA